MRMSAEFLPDWRKCGISIISNEAACIAVLNSLYRSQSQYAFLTTIEPLSSSRSRTLSMSNCAYFASRTPSAMFSKSQNTARLRASGMGIFGCCGGAPAVQVFLQSFEIQVDHRRDVQRQELRQQQAPDHRDAQRHARAAPGAEADGDRQAAHQRCHGGHHDRPESHQPGPVDRVLRRKAFLALRLDGEVDHDDGILLDDP